MIQNNFKFFFRLLLVILTLSTWIAPVLCHANPEVPPLPKKHGYLLIELDVEGVAPSLKYAPKRKFRVSSQQQTITFKDVQSQFLLLAVPKGRYQVTEVNAPLFNLPFRYVTSDDPHWEFEIKPGATNYFGKLIIEKERLTDSVNVSRHNLIAQTLELIMSKYAATLAQYPLVNAVGYRDDFFQEIQGPDSNDVLN